MPLDRMMNIILSHACPSNENPNFARSYDYEIESHCVKFVITATCGDAIYGENEEYLYSNFTVHSYTAEDI